MGLPRSGNAEQGLRLHACIEARCELRYGPRLVACWLIFAVYPESVPRRILHTETSGSFLGREASRFWNIRPDYTANAGFFSVFSAPESCEAQAWERGTHAPVDSRFLPWVMLEVLAVEFLVGLLCLEHFVHILAGLFVRYVLRDVEVLVRDPRVNRPFT